MKYLLIFVLSTLLHFSRVGNSNQRTDAEVTEDISKEDQRIEKPNIANPESVNYLCFPTQT